MALMDGLQLRELDKRRAQLNQSVYTAGLTNAQKPQRALNKMQRQLDKTEKEIINRSSNSKRRKPTAELIAKVNRLFGNKP
ncbi:hypothetical protein EFO91_15320 [Lactiplantibacillus plantarum]|uniref:hypothetical protein n=1 Tax=Lactiplantibacillus plantarum TaxID=1590 RepID=UPI0021A6088D|nr:hypothetical protein [Lactiplantibacillus plantarum]MCT3226984.1 hypothetical protein [Lactiplantibacillus plantarum]MCT3274354.1 hypothetical protein [Lactiplantibacillus plantarum]